MLVIFDKLIGNILTALQIGDLGGDWTGVKVSAAHDAQELVYKLETGKDLKERETAMDKFMRSELERDDALA